MSDDQAPAATEKPLPPVIVAPDWRAFYLATANANLEQVNSLLIGVRYHLGQLGIDNTEIEALRKQLQAKAGNTLNAFFDEVSAIRGSARGNRDA